MKVPSPVNFEKAFYIKLGESGGWESDSFKTGKLRFGWKNQTLEDINAGRWDLIEIQLRAEYGENKGQATRALHALQIIAQSVPNDVWITFSKASLWWTRVDATPVEQDDVSKFRRALQPWSEYSIEKRRLISNEIPGRLSQLQGYRWTVCRVGCLELLKRVLSGTQSDLAMAIGKSREALAEHLSLAIRELHWKDFETLVDLVFRHTGWIRVSVVGQQAKGYDLQLREPITGDLYAVQIKSRAARSNVEDTVADLTASTFKRVFFVVHSPEKDLSEAIDLPDHVKLVLPDDLAKLALDAGLASWLQDKVF